MRRSSNSPAAIAHDSPNLASRVLSLCTARLSAAAGRHGGEDASRVRNRNSLLIPGLARRSMMSIFRDWRRRRENQRQSTLSDFYGAMRKSNQREGWRKLYSRQK